MSRESCLIHANCQGVPLARLLLASPDFAARFAVQLFTNYTGEPVPQGALDGCRLLLYQNIGEKWGEVSSERLVARLPASASAWQIPNCLFKGYWPFWTNGARMDFGDSLLEHLVDMGLDAREILHMYLHTDLTKKADFAALLEESLRIEEAKEQAAVVRTVPFVRAFWREERLFSTINHPSPRLLRHVADGVLAALGYPPLRDEAVGDMRAYLCDPDPDAVFELPMHPQVAAFHGLAFGGPDERYRVFGHEMSFARYAACYVDCRLRGIESFLGYLQCVTFE